MQQNQALKNPNRHVITAKSMATLELHAVNSREKDPSEGNKNSACKILTIITVVIQILTPTKKMPIVAILTKQATEKTRYQKLSTYFVRAVAKRTS